MRSFAFVVPETAVPAIQGLRAIVEGAFVGSFDPGYYKSDRSEKDQKIDTLTIVLHGNAQGAQADAKALESAMQVGRIVAEVAKLYARPGQRTLQSHDADHDGRACEKDGGGSRPELRNLRRRQDQTT